jgi:hypothetical protein
LAGPSIAFTGRILRGTRLGLVAGAALAAVAGCGGESIASPDPVIVDVLPRYAEGTLAELGRHVGVRLNFFAKPAPPGEEHPRLDRVVSFELDDVEYVGRIDGPRIEFDPGAPYTLVFLEPTLEPGPHRVGVSVLDTRGERHRVAWTFTVLEEEQAPYDGFPNVASFLTVFPPPESRGEWSQIGPRIGFRASSADETFLVQAFKIDATSYLDLLSCADVTQFEVECAVVFQPPLPGDYLVLLSFRRSGDPDRIRRVRWFFNVHARGLPGSGS